MKALTDILYTVAIEAVQGDTKRFIDSIAFDSREVTSQGLFVALKGTVVDGHQYINKAIASGAVAVVCETLPKTLTAHCVYIQVANSHKALGVIAANFYDNPSQKMKVVGVTGTNGKTSVSTMLYELFRSMGLKSGLLSTVKVRIGDKEIKASHTTPDPIQIQKYCRAMVDVGVAYCFMEVSSHGIAQERIGGIHFTGGVFTNLSHDHLDYHKTFAAYRDVKKKFFDQLPKSAFALVNADDKNGSFMVQNCSAKKKTFAKHHYADYPVQVLEQQLNGMLLKIKGTEVWTPLVGHFNASNLIAVFAVSDLLGIETFDSLSAISQLQPVPGRFQLFEGNEKRYVVIDYAHTPDALTHTLEAINQIRTKNENLITVVGCGGNRDHEKRPVMGKVAAQLSDRVIFTSDNPRDEDPKHILEAMQSGVTPETYKKTLQIEDRKEAIRAAYQFSNPKDIILIAGKGHENYQEINGIRIPFDDFEIAKQIFSNSQ